MTIPQVSDYLPDLLPFVAGLVADTQTGAITAWPPFDERVKAYFTPPVMAQTDTVVRGWRAMAGCRDGITQTHVISAIAALLQLPEYGDATPEQQVLMLWIVLYHDVAKIARKGHRDATHGFRSAALTAQGLPSLGFAITDDYASEIGEWAFLTRTAVTHEVEMKDQIQDNGKLPAIMAGIDRLFGAGSPGARVVQGVLLHMSLNVVSDWPAAAPLTGDLVRLCIDDDLLPLLRAMMLVDNDAWQYFDAPLKKKYRAETLAEFERVQGLLNGAG
ncbi:MAG: hypothetical protein K8S97_11445 [Anaerolineae bacterium]|nr:hypothetical protein [Anaerolineae bacterium]